MIKVERSQPAPASLAAQKSHSGDDVRAALNEDFFGKCAWCEEALRPSRARA